MPITLFAQDATSSDTATMLSLLESGTDTFDKAKACQRLTIIGDETAVPALAALLGDERLSAYAREALEAIPGPAPDAALRESLTRLEGERLIGVLGSIGVRRDAEAVDAIVELLDSDDQAIASAAARSLGHIGTPAAADILRMTLSDTTPALRPAVGNACLICAQELLRDGETETALTLFDAVENADVPEHIRLFATSSAIRAQGEAGLPLLIELLQSEEESRFRHALFLARYIGFDVALDFANEFDNLSPSRQVMLLILLGDIGNQAVLPTVLEAAQTGEREVRIEAIYTLAYLGDATVVPFLLAASTDSDDQIAAAAQATLAVLDSSENDAAIVELLKSDDIPTLQMAINVVAQRKIASATPALLDLIQNRELGIRPSEIRASAIHALGSTAQLEHLPELIEPILTTSRRRSDSPSILSALKAACVRMPQEECASVLVAAMSDASLGVQIELMKPLATVGGATALDAFVDAAKSDEDVLQDNATRLLGEWLTADAAPAMLDLAKTLPEGKYQIRAIRGYVRIARQLNMTVEERMEVCRNTLAIAQRSDDKVLVFEVIRRYPTPEGFTLAVSLLEDEDLQTKACETIVSIAASLASESPLQVEAALLQVIELSADPALKIDAEAALVIAREGILLQQEEAEFVSVFDGVSLEGWTQPGEVFRVEDNAIVGGSLEKAIGKGNDYLCLDGEYGDFEIRLEARILGTDFPNGGIQLRSARNAASGYQADLGEEYYGCLYDEVRRARMLASANPKQTIETGQWVDYRIRCEGPRIRIWINGTQTVDYTENEPGIAMSGAIGLQSHANHASETWYRNIRVRRLGEGEVEVEPIVEPEPTPTPDESEFTSLFDGETLEGWHGNMEFWRIENDEIVGGSLTEIVANNEFLRSDEEYGDFELRLEFKLLGERTNGGVQIRTAEIPDHHEVCGYQADLGNGWWGCLYDEARRNRVLAGPPSDQRVDPVRLNEWNDYRIRCEGPRIQLWLNGVQTVDYTEEEPGIPLEGIIALQVHGNLIMESHYRNVRIMGL
jgi:HEAT repeat protein